MYRFSRTLYLELKDLVDPHPDTISVAEARRRVLEAAQSTVERLASDPRYFPQPARSLFQQIRCYFPISQQAHVFYAIERAMMGACTTSRNA
jgi:predicted RNase H-like HicB family nuclease